MQRISDHFVVGRVLGVRYQAKQQDVVHAKGHGAVLLHRDGQPLRTDRAVFDAADLLVMRGELADLHARVLDARVRHAAGEHIEPTEGPWCSYCPSYWQCPAKRAAIAAALAIEDKKEPVTGLDAGVVLKRIAAAKKDVGGGRELSAVKPGDTARVQIELKKPK